MFSPSTLIFVTDNSCLFNFIGKWNKKMKYPDGIQIFTWDVKRNVDLQRKFDRWQFDQKMCLRVLAVAVFMVRAISLLKDFCVVNTRL